MDADWWRFEDREPDDGYYVVTVDPAGFTVEAGRVDKSAGDVSLVDLGGGTTTTGASSIVSPPEILRVANTPRPLSGLSPTRIIPAPC
jgi:hypothetical protein